MFFNQQSIPRNPLVGFILNITTVLLLMNPLVAYSATLAQYCETKTKFVEDVFNERDQNTKQYVLDSITDEWNDTNRIMPWYLVVEMQRVVNNIYRKNNIGEYRVTDLVVLRYDTIEDCIYYGF